MNEQTIARDIGEAVNRRFTTDRRIDIQPTNRKDEYILGFDTYDLKIGGEDDIDGNDSGVFSEMIDIVVTYMKKNYSDIEVDDFCSHEKGYWDVTISRKLSKTEVKTEKQKAKLREKKRNLNRKYRQELVEFNQKVVTKIQNQSAPLKTCSHCKSKIAIGFIKTHCCNVCNKELYSNTEQKRVDSLNSKIKDTQV